MKLKINQIVMFTLRSSLGEVIAEYPVQVRSIAAEDELDYKGRRLYYVQPYGHSGFGAVEDQLREFTPEEKGEVVGLEIPT